MLRKNENTWHIPFLFLVAKAECSDLRIGKELGADDYIIKPFEDKDLLSAIEQRLKSHPN